MSRVKVSSTDWGKPNPPAASSAVNPCGTGKRVRSGRIGEVQGRKLMSGLFEFGQFLFLFFQFR